MEEGRAPEQRGWWWKKSLRARGRNWHKEAVESGQWKRRIEEEKYMEGAAPWEK